MVTDIMQIITTSFSFSFSLFSKSIFAIFFIRQGGTNIGISLAFGMSIFVLAYSIGHISGGHLNFAVTWTFCLLKKISILKCAYIIDQSLNRN